MVGAGAAVVATMMLLAWCGYRLESSVCAQGLFFAWLGALFPDVDTKSKGQKLVYAVVFVLTVTLLCYKKYLVAALVAIVSFVPLFTNHRGLFHRTWFAAAVAALGVVACSLQFPAGSASAVRNGLFFMVGFLSHLLLDFGFFGLLRRR